MPLKICNEKSSRGENTSQTFQPLNSVSKIKYIIGIAAGKGGVGKSSIAVNLALALKQKGLSVGILDADVYGPSMKKMLPIDRFPSQEDSMIIPALCSGIKTISMAYFRNEGEAAAIRAPIANGIIQQFITNVDWGNLDVLLIDFPPGTGDIQLTLCQKAHLTSALIVTTPQEIALLDVRKAIHLFAQVKIPLLGIVENMSYYFPENGGEKVYIFGKDGGKRLALEAGAPFLGAIPLDPVICACHDQGQSLFLKSGKDADRAKEPFSALAEQVLMHSENLKLAEEGALSNFQLLWRDL